MEKNFPLAQDHNRCDGMYKVWNKRASKIVLDGKTFKKKCPKRRGGSKPQWLVPKWAGARKKFECGWYDAAKDAFNSDYSAPATYKYT